MIKISRINRKNNLIKRKNSFLKGTATEDNSIYDAISDKKTAPERVLSQMDCDRLFYDFAFNKNLLKEIASASIGKGFVLDSGNEKLDEKVMERFDELQLTDKITEMLVVGMRDGISFLYPILKGANLKTGEELELKNVNKIEDFNLFESRDIITLNRQLDKLKPRYACVNSCNFKNKYGEATTVSIDSSYLTVYEPFKRPDKYTKLSSQHGDSFFKAIWDILVVKDNGLWSVGQLAYSMLLKVLKLGDTSTLKKVLSEVGRDKYQAKREMEVNSSTLLIAGKDDSLESVNFTAGLNIKDLKDYIYDELSGALRIPKSRLTGAQSGALASSESDNNIWYEYIENFQKDQLDNILRNILKFLYAEQKSYDDKFEIKFNSIKTTSKKEEAEISKIEAEALKTLVDSVVILEKNLKDVNLDAETINDLKDKILDSIKAKLGD